MAKFNEFSENKKEKFFSFPSIEQFRNAVQNIKQINGNLERSGILPNYSITFEGTVKLHGTNAGIMVYSNGDYVPQGRERSISIESDNYGFAAYALNPQLVNFVKPKLEAILKKFNSDGNTYISIGLFGEWAGVGIQKGVGIASMPRFFAPFGICLFKELDNGYVRNWLPTEENKAFYHEELRIFPVACIPNCTFEKTIDFSSQSTLAEVSNELSELTLKVEEQCPFAKHFGFEGIGEGIVWKNKTIFSHFVNFETQDGKHIQGECGLDLFELAFKVKGEKHSSSKVKTIKQLAPADIERIKKVEDFVEYVLTDSRLNQGFEYIKQQLNTENDCDVSTNQTGEFLQWISKDVIKEETDTLTGNGLCWKDVSGGICKKARSWFIQKVNEQF